MPLRAARIKISNIAGVEFVEFKPGSMTVVSGANETKAIAEGGHDATLQRDGNQWLI